MNAGQLETLSPHIRAAWITAESPALCCFIQEKAGAAHVPEVLLSLWDSHMDFLAPGSSSCWEHLGSGLAEEEDSFPVSPCHSTIQINIPLKTYQKKCDIKQFESSCYLDPQLMTLFLPILLFFVPLYVALPLERCDVWWFQYPLGKK